MAGFLFVGWCLSGECLTVWGRSAPDTRSLHAIGALPRPVLTGRGLGRGAAARVVGVESPVPPHPDCIFDAIRPLHASGARLHRAHRHHLGPHQLSWTQPARNSSRLDLGMPQDDYPSRHDDRSSSHDDTPSRSRGASRPSDEPFSPPSSKPRAQGRPGAGRARGPPAEKECRRQSPQVWPKHPALPARWLYDLYAISLGTGCLAPITRRQRAPQRQQA